MKSIINQIKKLDWFLSGSAIFLTLFGIVSLWSSSLGKGDFSNFQKQILFFVIGFLLMISLSFFDWRLLKNHSYILLTLYLFGILALLGLFVFAPEIRGTRGWYRIGGISFDPIEFMKLILIIVMAKYFSSRHREVYRFVHILLSGVYFFIPFILVFIQPNLGSACVLLALWFVILLVSGIRLKHFILLCMAGAIVFSLGWTFVLKDYQKDRIISFIEPQLDPLGIGWSQLQSKVAIGNGGIGGYGLGKGTQTQYQFLSEPQTDFIFASIAEEFGILGVLLLFLTFLVFVWRVLKIGIHAESNFPRLFATGFAGIIVVQFFVHVGMNLGLLPIVGLSLPFVSYGGSSLIFGYIVLGILQSMKRT